MTEIFDTRSTAMTQKPPKRLIGFWENWMNIENWGNGFGDMCLAGCPKFETYVKYIAPYTTVNYAFILLQANWYSGYDPTNGCSSLNLCGGSACPNCSTTSTWPDQDGTKALYWIPKCRGAPAFSYFIKMAPDNVTDKINWYFNNPTPALLLTRELCRMAHQHPDGPKEFNISLGGWTDCATIRDEGRNIEDLAELVAMTVLTTFADGVDLDFEHFSMGRNAGDAQNRTERIQVFGKFTVALRTRLDAISNDIWLRSIQACSTWLTQNNKTGFENYYNSNKWHLNDLCRVKRDDIKYTISYTTRFNAFFQPGMSGFPAYATDNEGGELYAYIQSRGLQIPFSYVNFMIYDTPLPSGKTVMDMFIGTVQNTLRTGYVPPEQIVCGVEPGIQAGAPTADRQDPFLKDIFNYVSEQNLGGVMVWAINNAIDGTQILADNSDYQNSLTVFTGLSNNLTNIPFSPGESTGYIRALCSEGSMSISAATNPSPISSSGWNILPFLIGLVIIVSIFTLILFPQTPLFVYGIFGSLIVVLAIAYVVTSSGGGSQPIPIPIPVSPTGPGPIPIPPTPCSSQCSGKACGECDGCGGTCNGPPQNGAVCERLGDGRYRESWIGGVCTNSVPDCHTELGFECISGKCSKPLKDCCLSTCNNTLPCGESRDNCTGKFCTGKCPTSTTCDVRKGACVPVTQSCGICW